MKIKDKKDFKNEPDRFKAMIEDDIIFLGFLTVLYGDVSQLKEYEHLRTFRRKTEGQYGGTVYGYNNNIYNI